MSSSRKSSASSIRSISSIKPKIPHQLPKLSNAKKDVENKFSFVNDVNEQDIKEDKALQRFNIMMKQLNENSVLNSKNKENKRVPSGKLTPLSPTTGKVKKLSLQGSRIGDKCMGDVIVKKNRLSPLRKNESDSDDSGSDADFRKNLKAPNELLQEFLVYVMDKKWQDAHKLCSFILILTLKPLFGKDLFLSHMFNSKLGIRTFHSKTNHCKVKFFIASKTG
ncbi:hypothetical protein BpHYR1_037447 [Brachionus plicatilis]|uniref:Uncharacterized protein n=1 Tax=Brachionus plicatilis TaxID=10195 RepID=A0A3M7SFC6_BRAPC|nr:hypothetical protein BpHYR1_037447 [Brachionus plicatilis]